jgi:hypothetical protein
MIERLVNITKKRKIIKLMKELLLNRAIIIIKYRTKIKKDKNKKSRIMIKKNDYN